MNSTKSKAISKTFEGLVNILMLLAFALVVITGVLSFIRLNNIKGTVDKAIIPDRKLAMAREIYSEMINAESTAKAYTLSGKAQEINDFYEIAERSGEKMQALKSLTGRDAVLSAYVDTLEALIQEKYLILDMVLANRNEFLVKKAMDQVMQNIEKNIPREEKADTGKTEEAILTDTVVEKDELKKQNFFTRLFGKRKEQEVTTKDTIPVQKPVEMTEPEETITVETLSQEVQKAQADAAAVDRARREREMELYSQDRLISEKLRKLMDSLDRLEADRLKENTRAAEKQASEVKFIMLSFGAASLFLLLLASISIFIYFRRNKEHRELMKKARTDAEELARAKERFLANMSHEIKTPMNIISGYLGQIMKTPLTSEQQEHIGIVKKSADHLLQLLNNLLDLSRMQANRFETFEAEINPAELVTDMQNLFTQSAGEKGIELRTEISPSMPSLIVTDPVRLRQILFNLVGNAVKFTSKGSVIIRASAINISDDKLTVVFEIADTGIGIPASDKEKIFGEFEQGSGSIDQKSSGTGLGLAITRKLTELLGGSIKLESQPGKGSIFRVELPCKPADGNKKASDTAEVPETEKLHGLVVLVADDEAYNRGLLKLLLGKYHCTVIEASNGREAISIVEERSVDIILMDIRMPGMNGQEAVREIKKITAGRGPDIPVIALSAAIRPGDDIEFQQYGFDACLPKPFAENSLLFEMTRLAPAKSKPLNYDLDPLKESCSGNESFFTEMVKMFLESTGKGLDELNGLSARKDWRQAAETAHRISAPCKHVKADKLYHLVKDAEKEFASGNPGIFAPGILEQAKHEFELIRADILARYNID